MSVFSRLSRGLATLVPVVSILAGFVMAQSEGSQIEPKYLALPPAHPVNIPEYQVAGLGLKTWTGSFTYLGTKYNYTMIGTDPSKGSATTTVKFVLIPLAVKFPGGVVLDPTNPLQSGCGTGTALGLTRNSPILKNVTWNQGGTNVGTTQYIDAFQRAEFWSSVSKSSPNYHVLMGTPIIEPKQTLDASSSGTVSSGSCGVYGSLDINTFDAAVQSIISSLNLQANEFPYFVTYDVFQSQGGQCCVLGYHSITNSNIVYGTGSYNDQAIFAGPPNAFLDIVTMSHEIGETVNDPFVQNANATPSWVSPYAPQYGCNNFLEVGDPLAGYPEPAKVPGNPHQYYVQDLAFETWFAKATTSTSVNGWYSMYGVFLTPAPGC
jgi:hypothetical protein